MQTLEVPQDAELRFVRAGDLISKRNPRRYVGRVELEEMRESIRTHGVIQPILCRITPDGIEIVAGNRRTKMAIEEKGLEYPMPIYLKSMSDVEAEAAATAENKIRENMSAVEEAESAARVLGEVKGDRAEAARLMGWSRQILDSRLALMNCSQKVRDAHVERIITLGHAELLAAVDKKKQDAVLEKLLASPTLPGLPEIKKMLEQISRSMLTAIFDKKDCAACPHNSALQRAMFTEAIAEGNCTNATCYDAKTEETLLAKKASLEETFQVVRIVRSGENSTLISLKAEGPTGVGADQAKACRACANFGAAVSAVPGKVGNVYETICFDSGCNSQKVAARIKAEQESAKAAEAESAKASTGIGTPDKGTKPSGASSNKAAGKPAAATSITLRNPIKEYREKVWRTVYRKEILADEKRSLRVLIAMAIAGKGNQIDSGKMGSAFSVLAGHGSPEHLLDGALPQTLEASEDVISKMLFGMAATAYEKLEIRDIVLTLRNIKADMTKHYKVDAELLEVLTKSEIEVLADELGLKAALGDKFAKTMAMKKEEIVKAMLFVPGFEYAGKVPKMMEYEDYFKK